VLADLLALTVPHEDIPTNKQLARVTDRRLLEPHVESLVAHMGSLEHPPRLEPAPEQHPLFYVLVFLKMLPHVRSYHRAHGISATDSRLILADLGRQLAVHRARTGTAGLAAPNWLNFAFRGMIYQVGRLQFERVPGALSVHIPEFCGPLSPASVDDALARSVVFFARHFPEERYDRAVCHSWLLSPQLGEYLPPESNIMRFQRRFTLTGTSENDATFQRFVFAGTRLREIVDRGIAAGRPGLAGSGYLRLPA